MRRAPHRTIGLVAGLLAVVLAMTSCEIDPSAFAGPTWPYGPGPLVPYVEVHPGSFEIPAGDSIRLTARAHTADATIDAAAHFTWRAIDTAIATVDDSGWVKARRPGSTAIMVQAAGYGMGHSIAGVRLVSDPGLALEFVAVEAGDGHTCALTGSGEAWCWGSGAYGQLGLELIGPGRWIPERVRSDVVFRRLSIGGVSSCAMDDAGLTWCWGGNWAGQLGTGSFDDRPLPTRVQGDETYALLDVGLVTTCALLATGRVRCWGGDAGRFGNGTSSLLSSAVPVDAASAHTFESLSVGLVQACGLEAGGRLLCWGMDSQVLLGAGSQYLPTSPTAIVPGTTFRAVAVGGMSCALDSDGVPHCWGNVGDVFRVDPRPVNTTQRFVSIVTGGAHACGLTADGRAFCWGGNYLGQLGTGGTDPEPSPRAVAGDHRFTALSAGDSHTCGLSTGGVVWCWGANLTGELGIGNREMRTSPVRVLGQK